MHRVDCIALDGQDRRNRIGWKDCKDLIRSIESDLMHRIGWMDG